MTRSPVELNARLAAIMDDAELDAVVCADPVTIRHLSGYSCWIDPILKEFMLRPGGAGFPPIRTLLIVERHRPPTLIVEPLWIEHALSTTGCDVLVAGRSPLHLRNETGDPPSFGEGALEILRGESWPGDALTVLVDRVTATGRAPTRLGLESERFDPVSTVDLNRRTPSVTWLDCSKGLRLIRAVKTPDEQMKLHRAAKIAEDAALVATSEATTESTPGSLANAFRAAVTGAGADFDHFVMCPYGLGMVYGNTPQLGGSGPMYVDFGCIYDGWFSDAGTTFSLDPLDDFGARRFAAARRSVFAGSATVRPGVRASVVQAAMAESFAEEGMDGFPHGHGIGLEVRDYPLVVPPGQEAIVDDCVAVCADMELEAGMVINLEAPFFAVGRHSVHCEQTFVVTDDGCVRLTTQERERPLPLTAESVRDGDSAVQVGA